MHSAPLPVHLVTGLLGSGKTTTLKHLIQQKPVNERWGILINEFGDIDIDAATLDGSLTQPQTEHIQISRVSGGCVCCTAQFGLVQAINELLQHPLDRLWIEPTGLGHPAKIIDTLKQTGFARPLALQAISCVITPQQLTLQRWQKSAVMRDLVNLADIILLNKTDLAAPQELAESTELLENLYPVKTAIFPTRHGKIDFESLNRTHQSQPFTLIEGLNEHQDQLQATSQNFSSQIPKVQVSKFSSDNLDGRLRAIGWVFEPDVQFNRVQLKAFFEWLSPFLSRAKGLLKTGNEWQLVNWSDSGLTFSDIAWRQDSRLELLFATELPLKESLDSHIPTNLKDIEIQLLSCINQPK